MATANQTDSTVSVFMNNGNGTLATSVAYPTAGVNVSYVLGVDIGSDGNYDLVLVNASSNNLVIEMNMGGGVFADLTKYTTGNTPNAVAYGDLNNDGFNDIVSANRTGNSISVFINNGVGVFAAKLTIALQQRHMMLL